MENENSNAIIVLCSQLCVGDDIKPYTPTEWSAISDKLSANNLQPYHLFSMTQKEFSIMISYRECEFIRLQKLLSRSASIFFEVEGLKNMGINILTRGDEFYPKHLKPTLGRACPPLFYYAGDVTIQGLNCVGFVGSRNTRFVDEQFTRQSVTKVNSKGFSIVTGGARGVDATSSEMSIRNGMCSVEYIADSIIKRIKSKFILNAVRDNRLLILSAAKPDAEFSTGLAMSRNRYIYCHSIATLAVKADYNTGGTWSGAVENLNKKWCPQLCWDNPSYKGNQELIKRGAFAIDDSWDGDMPQFKAHSKDIRKHSATQLTLFD